MQSRKYVVEPLSYIDIPWFVEVAAIKMFIEELKRPELINYDQLYTLTYKGVDEGTAFVVKADGELVGALGGLLVPNMFNPSITTLVELIWYVLPEYRNTRAGILLIDAFDKKAQECADEATLSLLTSSPVNFKSFEKRGFAFGESAFHKSYTRN